MKLTEQEAYSLIVALACIGMVTAGVAFGGLAGAESARENWEEICREDCRPMAYTAQDWRCECDAPR